MDRVMTPVDDSAMGEVTVAALSASARRVWAIAWVVWWLAVVGLSALFVVSVTTQAWDEIVLVAAFAIFPTVGLLMTLRQPANRLGWLMHFTAALFLIAAALSFYADEALGTSRSWPGGVAAAWLSQAMVLSPGVIAIFVPLLFPDGRAPSPRWRMVGWVGAVGIVLLALRAFLGPGPLLEFPRDVDNPVGIQAADGMLDVTGGLGVVVQYAAALLAWGSLVARWRRDGLVERQQIKWLLYAGGLLLVSILLIFFGDVIGLSDEVGVTASSIVLLVVLPGAIGVAVLRYERYDIDVIIRRTLVYGLLWTAIVVVYVGVAAVFGIAAGNRLPLWLAILGTITVTVAFDPVRRRFTGLAERWVFGERPSGFQVLTRLSATVDTSTAPTALLDEVACSLRTSLGANWCRASLASGERAVSSHAPDEDRSGGSVTLVVALDRDGDRLGTIECGPRLDGRPYDEHELELVRAVGSHAALAVHNAQLATRLVSATDAERRRIERDIHDGAQQTLVAIMTKLRLARRQLARQPAHAETTLVELLDDTTSLLNELRELAQGIHPTVLADGGLAEAVRERCARLPLTVTVASDTSLDTDRVDAQAETAAYFVVCEALANTLKHARATSARVVLGRRDGWVTIDVSDDGDGFDPALRQRRGLTGVSDRVIALGGSLRVQSTPGGGTTVRADIPAGSGNE
jgi:signal transduction histidine kinase